MPTLFRDKVEVGPSGAPVTFNDYSLKPAGSIHWGMDTLDGWDSSSELEVTSLAIGGGVDGEILGGYFPAKGRHMTASGFVTALDRDNAEALQDVVIGDAFPANRDLILARYESIPKYLRARVSGPYQIERVGPANFRWIVPLVAGDPFKYDLDPPNSSAGTAGVAGQSVGGRSYPRTYPLQYTAVTTGSEDANFVTLYNRGTADTYAIVSVNGPLTKGAWRLSNETTGEDVRFDVGLSAGDTLLIDFKEGTAFLNGFPVTASISGDFFKIVRGPNIIKLFGDFDPAAGFSASIESAWK